MKKVMVVILALLWVSVGIEAYLRNNAKDESKIVEAFNQTNFVDTESVITAYGVYRGAYLDRQEAKELLASLAEKIGLDNSYTINETRNKTSGEITLTKTAKRAQTKMRFITYEEQGEDNIIQAKQYLVMELTLYESADSALSYKNLFNHILQDYDFSKQFTVSLKGQYAGKLTLEERNVITDKLLKDIKADVVSERRSTDFYTIYAYTRLIDNYKEVSGEKINVSLAMNYNESENKTYLYLATPLIKDDF